MGNHLKKSPQIIHETGRESLCSFRLHQVLLMQMIHHTLCHQLEYEPRILQSDFLREKEYNVFTDSEHKLHFLIR